MMPTDHAGRPSDTKTVVLPLAPASLVEECARILRRDPAYAAATDADVHEYTDRVLHLAALVYLDARYHPLQRYNGTVYRDRPIEHI